MQFADSYQSMVIAISAFEQINEGMNIMGDNIDISVLCITYNHEDYIERALEGFLSQRGDFTYEIIVHDDASTDNTPEILKRYREMYPDKIRLILQKENQFSKKKDVTKIFCLPEARGKYCAFCEGDDEWICADKLQKQFEWMEAHPDTRLCLHNAIRVDNRTGERKLQVAGLETGFLTESEIFLCEHGSMPSASFFFRKEEMQNLPDYCDRAPVGDDPFRYCCAMNGEIYYINEAWSIWNYMHEGSWNKRVKNDVAFYYDYAERYIRFLYEFNRDSNKRFDNYIIKVLKRVLTSWAARKIEQGLTCEEFESFIKQKSKEYDLEYETTLEEMKLKLLFGCVGYDDILQKFLEPAKHENGRIYIYGAGKVAGRYAEKLKKIEQSFDGFVVSKKNVKEQAYVGYPVWELEELSEKKDNIYFILGMNVENKKEVIPILKQFGYKNVLIY